MPRRIKSCLKSFWDYSHYARVASRAGYCVSVSFFGVLSCNKNGVSPLFLSLAQIVRHSHMPHSPHCSFCSAVVAVLSEGCFLNFWHYSRTGGGCALLPACRIHVLGRVLECYISSSCSLFPLFGCEVNESPQPSGMSHQPPCACTCVVSLLSQLLAVVRGACVQWNARGMHPPNVDAQSRRSR